MMLKLYAVPVSLYCAKVRIILRHKKLDWQELLPPGGYGSQEYKKLVPSGNLPALIHDDLLLADSEAIAEYLNEVFQVPEMLPGDASERAKIRERCRFHDTRLEPVVRALFPHIAARKRDDDFVATHWSLLLDRLTQLEQITTSIPDELTLGDCGIAVSFTWISELTTHFKLSAVLSDGMQSYLDKLSEFDAVSAELADYRPRLANWLAEQ